MSADESVIAFTAAVAALVIWGIWLTVAAHTLLLARPGRRLTGVVLTLLTSLALVVVALFAGADPRVRSGAGYIVLFVAAAADTLAAITLAGSALGLPMLDGFVRRKNWAVGWAVAGLWLGTGLVNAGANVGRGDNIYTTLGPLVLALGTLLVLTTILAAATGRFRAVRLDRDTPAGVRAGALFVAWGLVLGRAVAGDWESTRRTWEDFLAYGWPALVFLGAAIVVERTLRPSVARPHVPWLAGVGPALAYVAAAVELVLRW